MSLENNGIKHKAKLRFGTMKKRFDFELGPRISNFGNSNKMYDNTFAYVMSNIRCLILYVKGNCQTENRSEKAFTCIPLIIVWQQ